MSLSRRRLPPIAACFTEGRPAAGARTLAQGRPYPDVRKGVGRRWRANMTARIAAGRRTRPAVPG